MNLFHDVKQDMAPEKLKVLIEIQKGDFNKYEYNHEYGVLELDRVLYGPVFYPVDYADVPRTWNEGDNDPLDVVVFSSKPIEPGTLVTVRVIGVMEMIDSGEEDHKILSVVDVDPRFDFVKDYKDLTEWQLKDLQTFWETYKYAQKGPDAVKIPGIKGKEEAYKIIKESMEAYDRKFGELNKAR